jgi:alanine racemase
MTLGSRIVAVRRPAGEGVGYGARFNAERRRRSRSPAGYADGLDLRLAGRECVDPRTSRPIVGAMNMDMR